MVKFKKLRTAFAVVLAAVLVLAMTTTVFAAGEAFTVNVGASKDSVKVGDTVEFTATFHVTGGNMAGFSAKVEASSNLQYQGATANAGPLSFSPSANAMALLSMSADTLAAGQSASVTYTYKVVDGSAGDKVSFKLSNIDGTNDPGDLVTYQGAPSAAVTIAAEPVPPTEEPTAPPTEQPTAPPTEQPTTDPTQNPSGQPTASATAKADDLDDVPKTGDTTTDLWVFVVLGIAAAATVAVVAGKKVHSK